MAVKVAVQVVSAIRLNGLAQLVGLQPLKVDPAAAVAVGVTEVL